MGLFYFVFPAMIEGYNDASWMTSSSDNRFISRWIFSHGGCAISWAFKKQTCSSHSTMESKFIDMATVGEKAKWLRNMSFDIKLWPQPMSITSLYYNTEATMSRAYSNIYNGKSRHISI